MRKWVNTRVIADIETGKVEERQGYWYEGPWDYAIGVLIGIGMALGFAGTAAAAIVGAVVMTGMMMGLSALSKLMAPKPPASSTAIQGRTVSIRMSSAPRRIVYGRQRLGGVLVDIGTTGSSNEYLHLVYYLCEGPIQSIDTLYFGDETVPLDGSGNATGKYAGLVHCEKKLGTLSDSAFAGLVAADPTAWTSDHMGLGCAAIYVRMKWDQDKLANWSWDQVAVDLHGKLVYDPRSFSTAYSENSALCYRDYMLTTKVAGGMGASAVDDVQFAADANLCDEAVTLKDTTTEPRYTCNGVIVLDGNASPVNVLGSMFTSSLAVLGRGGDGWQTFSACYRAPSGDVLTDSDARGPLVVTARRASRDLFNSVKGKFTGPDTNWQPTDYPAISDALYIAEDSGYAVTNDRGAWASGATYALNDVVWSHSAVYVCIYPHGSGAGDEPGVGGSWTTYWALCPNVVWKDLDLPFTISWKTAQRLAKIYKERNRRQMALAFPATLKGYQYAIPDVVQVTHSRWGFSSKTFELQAGQLGLDEKQMVLGIDLQLQETDSAVYSWNAAAEEGVLDAPHATTLPDATTVQPCANLVLASGSGVNAIGGDGIWRNRLKISWDSPADQFVLSGGSILIYYKKHADAAWTAWGKVPGSATCAYITNVTDGVAYDVKVVAQNAAGATSTALEGDNYTIVAVTSDISVSSLLNNQGSLAPITGTAGPFTYTTAGPASGKMFARLVWTAHTRYRPDGSNYSVAASNTLDQPPTPSLSNLSVANSLGTRTYKVRIAYALSDGNGERKFAMAAFGPEATGSWDNATLCKVLSPPAVDGYYGWLPLIGLAADGEVLQTALAYNGSFGTIGSPVPFGTDWVEPLAGARTSGGTTVADDPTNQALRSWDEATPATLYAWPSIKIQADAPDYQALQIRIPGGFLDDNNRPDIVAKVWGDGFDSDAATWITFTMPAGGGSGGGSGGGGCPRRGFMQRTLRHGGAGTPFRNFRWSRIVLANSAASEATPSHAIYRADANGELAAYIKTVSHLDDLDYARLHPFKISQERAAVGDSILSHDADFHPALYAVVEAEAFECAGEAEAISMEAGHLFMVGKPDGPGIVSCNRKII